MSVHGGLHVIGPVQTSSLGDRPLAVALPTDLFKFVHFGSPLPGLPATPTTVQTSSLGNPSSGPVGKRAVGLRVKGLAVLGALVEFSGFINFLLGVNTKLRKITNVSLTCTSIGNPFSFSGTMFIWRNVQLNRWRL